MSKKHKKKKLQLKARNVVALNPLLQKSAVHEKSGKAKRTAAKIQLKKTWFERVAAIAAAGQSQVFRPTFFEAAHNC